MGDTDRLRALVDRYGPGPEIEIERFYLQLRHTPPTYGGTYAGMSRLLLDRLGGPAAPDGDPARITPLGYVAVISQIHDDIVAGKDRSGPEDVPLEREVTDPSVPLGMKCEYLFLIGAIVGGEEFDTLAREYAVEAGVLRRPEMPPAVA